MAMEGEERRQGEEDHGAKSSAQRLAGGLGRRSRRWAHQTGFSRLSSRAERPRSRVEPDE